MVAGMYINGWGKNIPRINNLSEASGKINRSGAEEENFQESLLKRISGDGMQRAKEVPVRGIPYEECDCVRINVLEGYTVKIKLEDGRFGKDTDVYIEVKWDNGDKRACLYGMAALKANGSDMMEKIAYELLKNRK
ncbi:MAG: hypothetical protein ACI4D5_08420 [Kineothrix sp.]